VMGAGQTQSGQCVGCHAISRDGRRIVGSVGGINQGGVLMYDLESYEALWNESERGAQVLQFASFSPDSTQLAAVYGDDDRGRDGLFVYDVRCDASSMHRCGTLERRIATDGREPSHPSWAPVSGQWIAFTDTGSNAGSS